MTRRGRVLLCLTAVLAIPAALAQPSLDHGAHHRPPAEAGASAAAELASAEILRIDPGRKNLTLRHGPIHAIGMPAMTMAFQVADEALLRGYQVGDRVRFAVRQGEGALVVTHLEKAPQ